MQISIHAHTHTCTHTHTHIYLPPTIVCRVPQLPEQKLCTLINKVTVLLIDVVFFNANGQYECAVLKCIKKEGGRLYELVEVMKKPQEITCDCIFLEWLA